MKVFLAILFLPALAFASPQKVVEDIFSKAGQVEVTTSADRQNEITSMVDFSALAKSALGKEAKGVAPKEVEWFQQTLQEIITRTVYPKAPDFLKDVKIAYDKVEEKKDIEIIEEQISEISAKLEKIRRMTCE
jgi:ABC-type transporter MlaC component